MYIEFIRIGEILERRATAATSMIAGLSYSEVRLLTPLMDSQDQGLTRGQLAELSHLTPSAVSRALKPLEKSGYVATHRDARDARNARAALTPAGHERLSHALRAVQDLWDSLDFADLGLSEGLLAQVLERLHSGRRHISTPEQRLVGAAREEAQSTPATLPIPSRPGIKIT